MNKQSVFNTAWRGLASQNFQPSVDDDLTSVVPKSWSGPLKACRYRSTSSDRRCAIGHLMMDDEYDPTFEGHRFTDIRSMALGLGTYSVTIHTDLAHKARRFIQRLGIYSDKDAVFLSTLQDVHDKMEDIQVGLKAFAHTWGLTIPMQTEMDV